MPAGQVTANDILAYGGDSALAGGLGAAGTQQYIQGVLSLGDRIARANEMIQMQDFARKKQEFDQKMKDREEFAKLLDSEQLQTTDMDDEDRIEKGKMVAEYKNKLIDAFKKKGKLDDKTYLELHNQYGSLRDDVIRAKTNYAAIKADMDAQADPYDKSPGYTKTISKTVTTNEGQVTTQEQEKTPNIRSNEENKSGLQKHIEAFREEKKKNPYAIYKPYVPMLSIKDEDVFLPIVSDETKTKTKDGLKVNIESKPNIQKSLLEYQKAASDPNKAPLLKKKWNDILSSGYGAAMIIDANKKLSEIQTKEAPHYGQRNDGTNKGSGYYGPLKMNDGSGSTATEISVGVEFDGKEVEIPTLVPGLNEKEKKFLLDGNDPRSNTETGKKIMEKAIAHANKRIENGQSPFANDGPPKFEITPQSNYLQGMALLNFAQKYDKATTARQEYINANAEKMELEKFKTQQDIILDNVRTKNQMRVSDNSADNQIRVAKAKPQTTKATSARGGVKEINTGGVYYESGKKQVDMFISKANPIKEGDRLYKTLIKHVNPDDIASAREVSYLGAPQVLKSYLNGRQMFIVEHKDGEITFNDTYGTEYNMLDLITVAAGNSKQARAELLGIGSDGEPLAAPEAAAPKTVEPIKSSSGKTITVNPDGTYNIK